MYVTRFELATFWSVARRSIQLSYTYILHCFFNSKYDYNFPNSLCQQIFWNLSPDFLDFFDLYSYRHKSCFMESLAIKAGFFECGS